MAFAETFGQEAVHAVCMLHGVQALTKRTREFAQLCERNVAMLRTHNKHQEVGRVQISERRQELLQ